MAIGGYHKNGFRYMMTLSCGKSQQSWWMFELTSLEKRTDINGSKRHAFRVMFNRLTSDSIEIIFMVFSHLVLHFWPATSFYGWQLRYTLKEKNQIKMSK